MGTITTQDIGETIAKITNKHVYFDTNPIIHFLNGNTIYFNVCKALFQAVEDQSIYGYSSDLCLAELLVKPLRDNNHLEIRIIKGFFDDGFFQVLNHDRSTLELSATIRAMQRLKMIDAVHVATAIQHGCDYIVTADEQIVRNTIGISVINLNQYIQK